MCAAQRAVGGGRGEARHGSERACVRVVRRVERQRGLRVRRGEAKRVRAPERTAAASATEREAREINGVIVMHAAARRACGRFILLLLLLLVVVVVLVVLLLLLLLLAVVLLLLLVVEFLVLLQLL